MCKYDILIIGCEHEKWEIEIIYYYMYDIYFIIYKWLCGYC